MSKEITKACFWISLNNGEHIPVSHSEASRILEIANNPKSPSLVKIGGRMENKYNIKRILSDKDFKESPANFKKNPLYEEKTPKPKPDMRTKEQRLADKIRSYKSFILNYLAGRKNKIRYKPTPEDLKKLPDDINKLDEYMNKINKGNSDKIKIILDKK